MIVPKETQERILRAACMGHKQPRVRDYGTTLGSDEAHEIALKANVGITRAMRGDLGYVFFAPYPGDEAMQDPAVTAFLKHHEQRRSPPYQLTDDEAVRPKELEVHLL